MTSLNPPDAMVTYRRVDGELIYGEFSFALHPDSLDEDFSDEPVEYHEEIWTLLERKTIVKFPPVYSCAMDPDCDNDAVQWVQRTVDGIQKWIEACEAHLEERDQQDGDDRDEQADDDVSMGGVHEDTVPARLPAVTCPTCGWQTRVWVEAAPGPSDWACKVCDLEAEIRLLRESRERLRD